MRTYYIFNVNRYFSYIYKNKPFKMYKIFEDIYQNRNYDVHKTYHLLEEVTTPFNKTMLNEYIYHEYRYKYSYFRKGSIHTLNNSERTVMRINSYNIKIETESNYSCFFLDINNYNNDLFVCDFDNKDYFWLSKLINISLQKEESIVK